MMATFQLQGCLGTGQCGRDTASPGCAHGDTRWPCVSGIWRQLHSSPRDTSRLEWVHWVPGWSRAGQALARMGQLAPLHCVAAQDSKELLGTVPGTCSPQEILWWLKTPEHSICLLQQLIPAGAAPAGPARGQERLNAALMTVTAPNEARAQVLFPTAQVRPRGRCGDSDWQ